MSPTPKRIGRRLKALREVAGLTQPTVARRAHLSREYLARLEAGQHDPTVGTLDRLAKALTVPLCRLLDY
jgi:transcriptional regulator with XRE-family HTH domain